MGRISRDKLNEGVIINSNVVLEINIFIFDNLFRIKHACLRLGESFFQRPESFVLARIDHGIFLFHKIFPQGIM